MRVGVVALIVLAVGCGRAPPSTPTVDDATVLSILRDRTGVLDRGGFTWVAGATDYFRQGTSRLREGRVKTLSDAEVRRRFEASDVLLVADVHD